MTLLDNPSVPRAALIGLMLAGFWSAPGGAAVSPEAAAALGTTLTPTGAERAGNADGSIPEWSGKWLGAPEHVDYDGVRNADPYPDDQPLFTITAENLSAHADRLSAGQKALFERYPDSYRMRVYPTRRDFRYSDQVNENVRLNALQAQLLNNGQTLKGAYGGVAFPIPANGLEVVYNIMTTSAGWMLEAPNVAAFVQPGGAIAWARNELRVYNRMQRGDDRAGWDDGVFSQSISLQRAPPREAGKISFTVNTFDFVGAPRQAWQYDPGTRRLRKSPDVGFDYPMPVGPRVVDEQNGFNGSPERYDWTLVGRQELYVPFHTNRLESPDVRYADIIATRGHPNPELIRWERRRVWVVEGTLKPGLRHVYSKRRFYVEEDSWHLLLADLYDRRGQLWRVTQNTAAYAYDGPFYYLNASFYHDLTSGAYSAENITTDEPSSVRFNRREPRPGEFSLDGIRRDGV